MTHAAQRFARFQAHPEVVDITNRYADWARTDGLMTNVQLAGLAMLRVRGQLSRNEYRKSDRKLAATSGVPLQDFLLLARCQLEATRWMLIGSGQMTLTGFDGEGD